MRFTDSQEDYTSFFFFAPHRFYKPWINDQELTYLLHICWIYLRDAANSDS